MNWFDAMQAAKQSRFLGKADWRIPSKAEFEAVVGKREDCRNRDYKSGQYAASSAIAHSAGTDEYPGFFWSSSPIVGDSGYAWGADFGDGNVNGYGRNDGKRVRLVRASQSSGGKAALEFNAEYAKIDQYKKEIAATEAKEEKNTKQQLHADTKLVTPEIRAVRKV